MTRKTQPPGAPTTVADVADVYLQALTELKAEVVRQGELTRAKLVAEIDRLEDEVVDLRGRVDELEAMAVP